MKHTRAIASIILCGTAGCTPTGITHPKDSPKAVTPAVISAPVKSKSRPKGEPTGSTPVVVARPVLAPLSSPVATPPLPPAPAAATPDWRASYRVVSATGLANPVQLVVDGQEIGSYTSGATTGVMDANKPEFAFQASHKEHGSASYLLKLKSQQNTALVLHQKSVADSGDASRRELGFTLLDAPKDSTQRTVTLLLVSASTESLSVALGTRTLDLKAGVPQTVPLPRNREGGDLPVRIDGEVLARLDTQTTRQNAIILYHEDATNQPACITFGW